MSSSSSPTFRIVLAVKLGVTEQPRVARKLSCTMGELDRLDSKSRFSLILPGDVPKAPEARRDFGTEA